MKAKAKPLPPDEWNFSELDDKEISHAFYYEYGRNSEFVKSAVTKIRAWINAAEVNGSGHEIGSRLYGILWWLGYEEPHFPNTSWLSLKAGTIAKIQKERATARRIEAQINTTLPTGQKFCSGMRAGQPSDPVEPYEWMSEALKECKVRIRFGGAGFWHVWQGDPKAYKAWMMQQSHSKSTGPPDFEIVRDPAHSHMWGGIDWNLTDSEIMEKFQWFLKRSRPPEFRNCAATPHAQRGFDNSFPFRMNAALGWLGVLQRRNATKTWRQYFEFYHDGKFQRGAERAREEDCRKAKLILKWFNTGEALHKKDFK